MLRRASWPSRTLLPVLLSTPPLTGAQIAQALNRAGTKAPPTEWSTTGLTRMIQRGALCGWRDWNPGSTHGGGELLAMGAWDPILSRQQVERIRLVLNASDRDRPGRRPRGWLVGVLKCGRCGASLYSSVSRQTGRKTHRCNAIPGKDRCGQMAIAAAPVDLMVRAVVLDFLSTAPRSHARRKEADRFIEGAHWASPHWTDESRHLARAPRSSEELARWWDGRSLEWQREVVGAIFEKIVIRPASRSGNQFDPGRVDPPVWRV